MTVQSNPFDKPEWHYIRRECMLSRHLVGSGATALGRASYGENMGEYYIAFFGLTIGMERLSKLILVADYAIKKNGKMPDEKVVRTFGHNLTRLLDTVADIQTAYNLEVDYPRPTTFISKQIVVFLDHFADANQGRYANFSALGNPNLGQHEPIKKWWEDVAKLILQEHCKGKAIRERIERRADFPDHIFAPFMVLFINEMGIVMQDMRTLSIHADHTKIVQRYGRFYALTVVRWLSNVFSKLAHSACYTHKIDAFSGTWEYFQIYMIPDDFFRTRKIWPQNRGRG